MGLFDRLFGRKEKVDEPETEEFDGLDAGFRMWEDVSGFGPAKHDADARDKDNLVEFNAGIANALRFPHQVYVKNEIKKALNASVSSADGIERKLDKIFDHEFGDYDGTDEMHVGAASISETLAKELEDGQPSSIREIFDKVNSKYDVSKFSYENTSNGYDRADDYAIKNAAKFVHPGDTLEDVSQRADDLERDVARDYGIRRSEFSSFPNIEESFQEGLEAMDDDEFFKADDNYYEPTFHSTREFADEVRKYKDVHNKRVDRTLDRLNHLDDVDNDLKDYYKSLDPVEVNGHRISDKDVDAFATFATARFSDVEKREVGMSMSDIIDNYDTDKIQYLHDQASHLQADALDVGLNQLSTRYEYILHEEYDNHAPHPEASDGREFETQEARDHYNLVRNRDGVAQDTMADEDLSLYATNVRAFTNRKNEPVLAMEVKKRDDVENEHSKFDGQYVSNRGGEHAHTQYLKGADAKRFLDVTRNQYTTNDPYAESIELAASENHTFSDVPFNADVKQLSSAKNEFDYVFNPKTIQPSLEYYEDSLEDVPAPRGVDALQPTKPEVEKTTDTPKATPTKAKEKDEGLEP